MSSNTNTPSSPIKTIVVLVQENRSFDHMLGWMKSINPEINGVTGEEFNLISLADPNSAKIQFGNHSEYVDPDPGHTLEQIYEQVYGEVWQDSFATTSANKIATMTGFAQQAEAIEKGMSETVMNGFRPESIPVFKELVSEFSVCDRWFSSIPSLTQPNRLFVHSATSYGQTTNDTLKLIQGLPQKTIFESLDEADYSFGIYYQILPSTLFYRNLRRLKYFGNFHQFDLNFERHCRDGKLPNYTVIEQRYFGTKLFPGNDDHPSHDVTDGQNFVKKVYEALRSSPQWNEMLFIIVYDEHGGFYDHVPTPSSGVPTPDDIDGPAPSFFKFDRLGVRVPCIMISPWIEKGTVLHGPSGPYPNSEFEHSSIPATVKKIFNLNEFLTKRDAWAGTFETVITRTSPRTDCPLTLPDAEKIREESEDEAAKLSTFQKELVQTIATLNGDCHKDIYPDKLVENMTVGEAIKYCEDGYKTFCDECENAKQSGTDGSEICVPKAPPVEPTSEKTLGQKLLSCLVCDNS
ncbi:phospholipase C [Ranunculus cassubicifolius]